VDLRSLRRRTSPTTIARRHHALTQPCRRETLAYIRIYNSKQGTGLARYETFSPQFDAARYRSVGAGIRKLATLAEIRERLRLLQNLVRPRRWAFIPANSVDVGHALEGPLPYQGMVTGAVNGYAIDQETYPIVEADHLDPLASATIGCLPNMLPLSPGTCTLNVPNAAPTYFLKALVPQDEEFVRWQTADPADPYQVCSCKPADSPECWGKLSAEAMEPAHPVAYSDSVSCYESPQGDCVGFPGWTPRCMVPGKLREVCIAILRLKPLPHAPIFEDTARQAKRGTLGIPAVGIEEPVP